MKNPTKSGRNQELNFVSGGEVNLRQDAWWWLVIAVAAIIILMVMLKPVPFREIVSDPGPAKDLTNIMDEFESSGIEVGGLHYKKVPRGYQEEYQYSRFLKHNGLYGMRTTGFPEEFFSSALLDLSIEWFRKMNPLNHWLLKYLY